MNSTTAVLAPEDPEWFLQGTSNTFGDNREETAVLPDAEIDASADVAAASATDLTEESADFIIRSLRRRLWHALKADDADRALRAYQATLSEFQQWLHEEQQERLALWKKQQDAIWNENDPHLLQQQQQQQQKSAFNDTATASASKSKNTLPTKWNIGKSSRKKPPGSKHTPTGPTSTSTPHSTFSHSKSALASTSCGRAGVSQRTMTNADPHRYAHDLLHPYEQPHQQEKQHYPPGRRSQLEAGRAILQTLMNPSEPFIADDYLSPYDLDSYHYPARKDLPYWHNSQPGNHDQHQHPAQQQQSTHLQRGRSAWNPLSLFRTHKQSPNAVLIDPRRPLVVAWDEDVNRRQYIQYRAARTPTPAPTPPATLPGSLDFQQTISQSLLSIGGAVDDGEGQDVAADATATVSTTTTTTSAIMTTPLHEAARLGAGNLIRIFLANGGDPNIKNGKLRTALHMVSGGRTQEEEVSAATAAAAAVSPPKKQNAKAKAQKTKQPPLASSPKKNTTKTAKVSTKTENKSGGRVEAAAPVGIASPTIPLEAIQRMKEELYQTKDLKAEENNTRKGGKTLQAAVGRFVRSAFHGGGKEKAAPPPSTDAAQLLALVVRSSKKKSIPLDADRCNHLSMERMDSVLAVLAWCNGETGDGTSINAVDVDGRTALHYAAELGRSDVCMAILSNFGAMLTIIDELGARTPCELAGANGHPDLAAQLEARALLYIDPYGVDDELMANMLQMEQNRININSDNQWSEDERRNKLVTPFCWYQTMTLNRVGVERVQRLETARAKLLKVVQAWDHSETTTMHMEQIMPSAALMKGNIDGVDGPATTEKLSTCSNQSDKDEQASDRDSDEEVSINPSPALAGVMAAGAVGTINQEILETSMETKDSPTGTSPDADPAKQAQRQYSITNTCDAASNLQIAFSYLQESHVERYLTQHRWDLSKAVKVFKANPKEAFSQAGIELPSELPTKTPRDPTESRTCLICYDDEVKENDWVTLSGCVHGFCTDCLSDYLKDCASTKMAISRITCPHHQCDTVLTPNEVNKLLKDEPAAANRIQDATHEQFVTSAHDFMFCTHPGCLGIVHRAPAAFLTKHGIDDALINYTGAVCCADPSYMGEQFYQDSEAPLTYEGVESPVYQDCRSHVQPRPAHRFCFECGDKRHWPITCKGLEEWRQKIQEEIGTVVEDNEGGETNPHKVSELAQKLWIKTNTRPCPKCEVPIEKDDGCNHMTCTNPACRYEFCWICRKEWKLHSVATGGFFRCNIWQDDQDSPDGDTAKLPATIPRAGLDDVMDEHGYGTAIHTAREAHRVRQEMARFVHHYTRWEAHGESASLEKKMADSVCTRLAPVIKAAIDFDGSPDFNFGGKGLSFVHAAFTELLECRSFLKHSYAFSYFRYPSMLYFRRHGQLSNRRREKFTFERMQSELEMLTEQMSDIVARSHLRATQVQITFLTANAAEKREDFSNLLFSILHDEHKEVILEEEAVSATAAAAVLRSSQRATGSIRHGSDGSSEDGRDGSRTSSLNEIMGSALALEVDDNRMWECGACTYMNDGGRRCAMCGTIR